MHRLVLLVVVGVKSFGRTGGDYWTLEISMTGIIMGRV